MSPDTSQDQPVRITATENGPYHVEGPIKIRNARGEEVDGGGDAWLCRCGGSQNKPFCDGTHEKNGFQGACVASRDTMAQRRDAYACEGLTIFDDRTRCSHAGRCTDGLPMVWKMNEEPWIDPNGAGAEEIVATIRQCPSGALTYALAGSDETVEEEMEPAIWPAIDGPYRVRGGIPVFSHDGEPFEVRNRQTLCRCGKSKNKPFCDGTHWYAGFKDPVE